MTNGARDSHPQRENANESQNAGGTPAYQGWHSRGYLPHCDYPGLVQAIGLGLFDSVPVDVIEYIERNPVNAKLVSQPDQWRFSSAASHHQQRVKRARAKFPEIDPEQLP